MGDIEFACPQCGTQLAVDAEGAGMTVNCPNCAELIVIPIAQSGPEPKAGISELELPADTRKGAGTKWWLLLAVAQPRLRLSWLRFGFSFPAILKLTQPNRLNHSLRVPLPLRLRLSH